MTTSKQAIDIFERWMAWQPVYQYRDLTSFKVYLDDDYWNNLSAECAQDVPLSNAVGNLFSLKRDSGFYQQSHFIEDGNAVLESLLGFAQNNMLELANYLETHYFSGVDVNHQQATQTTSRLLEHFIKLLNTLFYHQDSYIRSEYLFSLANKVFEFCFVEQTYTTYNNMLIQPQSFPLVRLIQSTLWQFLSSEGWRNWHVDCLSALKAEYENGKTIVYIGGGSDIYQLLAHGIYNIEVIDPLLPSQADNFYSDGWQWLAEGSIGDTLTFNSGVILHRAEHQVFDTFNAMIASGQHIEMKHTSTIWRVYDGTSQALGEVIFERRFAMPEDLAQTPSKALLTSFNELYLLGAPKHCDGWEMVSEQLSDELTMFVKQLRKPISGQVLKRISQANDAPFTFVNLGGCAT